MTWHIRHDRRSWLKTVGSCLLAPATGIAARPTGKPPLDTKTVVGWRDHYAEELFARALPFWDRHGIDHQRGGFQCALDYDGRKVDSNKFHWYQGRGIWVYSYLYNHFKDRLPDGQHPRTLSIARKAADFWLKHGPNKQGWWPELLGHDGRVIQAFRGDVYSAFTTIEGCQELAFATNDDALRDQSFRWLKKAYAQVTRRDYHDPYARQPGWRVQGIWIYVLNCCTQMLARWDDKSLKSMADTCIEALLERHHNPDIGLNNEFLDHDFSRIPEEANRCLVGHCLQGLWHVVKEARRRGDQGIEQTSYERIRRHLDIGWDHVHGGLCEWVNVGQFDHEWGPQKLGSQTIPLKMKGEYNYVKSFWALNEVLVATLMTYESTRAPWAARYFTMAQDIADRHFSRQAHGQASYRLATDRRFRFVPRSTRQDNYHPLRRLMVNLQALDRLATS